MANKASKRREINNLIEALKANGVNLLVESYSPGDGWTRYAIALIEKHGNPVLASSMNSRECVSYLQGIFDAMRFRLGVTKNEDED